MIQKSLIKVMLLITIVFFFSGCGKKDAVTKGVIGSYAITKIIYKGKSLLRNLSINDIEFQKDGKVIIPEISDRHNQGLLEDTNILGIWKLVQVGEKFQINIETKNVYFNQKFDLSFSKDEDDNIIINLKSDSLSLIGEKNFFDYVSNKLFVDEIIKYTK